jgi:hypothetical protein
MVGLIVLGLVILGIVIWFWTGRIDYMAENYPDYKGEDFFNEEDKNEVL